MTETIIKKGTYACSRTWSAVEIPADLNKNSQPQLLESTARIVSDIRYECEEFGRAKDHNPHCADGCQVQPLIAPLDRLLRGKTNLKD
jgi:hypothetical protein